MELDQDQGSWSTDGENSGSDLFTSKSKLGSIPVSRRTNRDALDSQIATRRTTHATRDSATCQFMPDFKIAEQDESFDSTVSSNVQLIEQHLKQCFDNDWADTNPMLCGFEGLVAALTSHARVCRPCRAPCLPCPPHQGTATMRTTCAQQRSPISWERLGGST